jgi:hypothetical protein
VFRYETLSDERNFIYENALRQAPPHPRLRIKPPASMSQTDLRRSPLHRSVSRLLMQDQKERVGMVRSSSTQSVDDSSWKGGAAYRGTPEGGCSAPAANGEGGGEVVDELPAEAFDPTEAPPPSRRESASSTPPRRISTPEEVVGRSHGGDETPPPPQSPVKSKQEPPQGQDSDRKRQRRFGLLILLLAAVLLVGKALAPQIAALMGDVAAVGLMAMGFVFLMGGGSF